MVEKFVIRDAHNKGVTAIAVTNCGTKLITGGGEGQVGEMKYRSNKNFC